MSGEDGWVTPLGNELAKRAPNKMVIENWRLWWFAGVLVGLSVILAIMGVSLSIELADWAMLGRFGAFISVVGSYLVARPVWRTRYKSRFTPLTLVNGNRFTIEQQAEYIMERVDEWSFFSGFVIAAIGTVIWGFADLLNCILLTTKCALPL
jgi:amino acid transporter